MISYLVAAALLILASTEAEASNMRRQPRDYRFHSMLGSSGVTQGDGAYWPDHGLVPPQMDALQKDAFGQVVEDQMLNHMESFPLDQGRDKRDEAFWQSLEGSGIPELFAHQGYDAANSASMNYGRSLFPEVDRKTKDNIDPPAMPGMLEALLRSTPRDQWPREFKKYRFE